MIETVRVYLEAGGKSVYKVQFIIENTAIRGAGATAKKNSGLIIQKHKWLGTGSEYGPWIAGDDEQAAIWNNQLREGLKKLRGCYNKLKELHGQEPTCRDVMDMFVGKEIADRRVKIKSIFDAIEDHVTAAKLEESTAGVYRNGLIPAIRAFLQAKYKATNILLKDIDVTFIYRFEMYMQKAKSPRGKPYTVGTVREYVFKLKAVLRTAKRTGEIAIDIAEEHESMTGKPEKTKAVISNIKEAIFWKIPLEQLHKIETVPISGSGVKDPAKEEENSKDRYSYDLVRVRLLFLLQTWTGLAFADLEKMKDVKSHIITDLTGKKAILYYRQKTGELAMVPLFPQTEEILKALDYNGSPLSSYDTYNRKIKALLRYYAIELEEDETSVTHLGRHLFGSRMLNKGASMESISRMMGHSSIKETEKTYARIDLSSINADFDRIKLTEEIGTKIAV